MPRPPDTYTHSQFETVESDFRGETVRCVHCRHWTGNIKALSRKKEHLFKCPAYAGWREAGHGQDLAPQNKYNKRDSSSALNDDSDLHNSDLEAGILDRRKLPDVSKHFDEFWDDASEHKCMRTRCKYCGAARAKNSTRQFEHLETCTFFLDSAEGREARFDPPPPSKPSPSVMSERGDIWRGSAPNPNLIMTRQPIRPRPSGGGAAGARAPPPPPPPPPQPPKKPSLVVHLLSKYRTAVEEATQVPFLSHAGCGTLSRAALQNWLAQQGHTARALTTFTGSLVGKIRLPDSHHPHADPAFRTFDLLVTTLNNAQRELEFLRTTQLKYGLSRDAEQPNYATKGFTDLFGNTASPSASLLEGMVVLWAVEHLFCVSWTYASTFVHTVQAPSTAYSLPSYMQPGQAYGAGAAAAAAAHSRAHGGEGMHTAALHEALIPNWTSTGFGKFVEACRAIVDELANAQTSGSGAAELNNCEIAFRQVVWLWRQLWPEVAGMGDVADDAAAGPDPVAAAAVDPPLRPRPAPASNGAAAAVPVDPNRKKHDDRAPSDNDDAPAVDSPDVKNGGAAAG